MSTQSTYKRMNQGAARLMFILGLGMVAVILGSVLSVGLAMRLGPRLQGLPLPVLQALDLLIRHLWCLLILPLIVHAAARVADLRVWSTVAGSLLSGSVFLLLLGYLQRGGGGVWRGAWDFISWVLVMGMSALLIRRAVRTGARHREAQAQKAKAQAAAKVSEYDAFRAEAEAQADRHAAREVSGAPSGAETVATGDAPADTAADTGLSDSAFAEARVGEGDVQPPEDARSDDGAPEGISKAGGA